MTAASKDQPAVAVPSEILDLAPELEQLWRTREQVARESPLGLVAMAEGDEGENEETQPPPEGDPAGGEEKPAEDNANEEIPSFLDEYDLGEVPDEGREVVEAYIKRIGGAYTRQRQEDTKVVREARQYQEVVEGLMNPQTRAQVAHELGIPLAQAEEEFGGFDDDEFFEDDPMTQIGELRTELQRRDEAAEAERAVEEENVQIANGIEALERQQGVEFSDEEIDLLTMYAEEFRDGDDNPDVAAAYKVFDAVVSGRLQQMTKRKSEVPRRMGRGAAASKKVDLTDEAQQLDAMERAVAAARASRE